MIHSALTILNYNELYYMIQQQDQPNQPRQQIPQNKQNIQYGDEIQEQQSISPVQYREKNPKYVTVSSKNFIKSIRKGFTTNIICIYEEKPFTVQIRNLQSFQTARQNQNSQIQDEKLSNMPVPQIKNIGNSVENVVGQIKLESVPYDCLQFTQNSWFISSKGMPPRIYKRDNETHQIVHIASICNRKKNSQLYLSPIQLAQNKNSPDYVIGGGRRFLCKYNLQKMVDEHMYSKFDKSNISTVQMLNQNTAIVGTFEGAVSMIDLREEQTAGPSKQKQQVLRPHVDGIMSIVGNPMNEYIFASNARKDYYTYVWDCRKYKYGTNQTTFLSEMILPKEGNQRIDLTFSKDGNILFSGSESAQIIQWNYQNGPQFSNKKENMIKKWKVITSGTVNSLICSPTINSLIFSSGSRTFPEIEDNQEPIQTQYRTQNQNILGYFTLQK